MKSHMTTDVVAIEAAKKILDLDDKYKPLREEIQTRLQIEMDKLKELYEAEHKSLWSELTDKMQLPRTDALAGIAYKMDKDYMDEHGVLFLLQTDVNPDDDCDCEICTDRRSKGYPGGSLADMLKEAILGRSVN